MKKTRNFFMTIVMAFVMLFAAFAPFVGVNKKQASALSPDYTAGYPGIIYYFCDLYPSIDSETLIATYGSRSVILDRQPVTEQEFISMLNNDYFSGFGDGCIVVIDIKTFDPSAIWETLFWELSNQGCTTVLVTSYTFSSTYSPIDEHTVSQLYRLKNFIGNTLEDIKQRIGELKNFSILIDGNFVDADYYWGDIQSLCEKSPFVRIFMEAFGATGATSYASVLEDLKNFGIKLLVDVGNNMYLDIVDWTYYNATEVADSDNTFAMGCSALDSNFYNDLYSLQTNGKLSAVYMMEGDPFDFSSTGLAVITEWDLAVYGWEGDEATPVINTINGLLN